MAEDGDVADVSVQQQQQQQQDDRDSELERDQHHVDEHASSSSSSSSSPTIMAAGGRDVSDVEGAAAAAAAAAVAVEAEAGVKERPGHVFDIVLPSPTGARPGSGASTSALTSPMTPSTCGGGGWSMSSSTDGSTLCFGDERLMLTDLGRRFYNRRALSDVKLRVGDRVYRCHKLLLALSSDVLERMLCSADWTDAAKQVSSPHGFAACFSFLSRL